MNQDHKDVGHIILFHRKPALMQDLSLFVCTCYGRNKLLMWSCCTISWANVVTRCLQSGMTIQCRSYISHTHNAARPLKYYYVTLNNILSTHAEFVWLLQTYRLHLIDEPTVYWKILHCLESLCTNHGGSWMGGVPVT